VADVVLTESSAAREEDDGEKEGTAAAVPGQVVWTITELAAAIALSVATIVSSR
jgi:hypothetical protein